MKIVYFSCLTLLNIAVLLSFFILGFASGKDHAALVSSITDPGPSQRFVVSGGN